MVEFLEDGGDLVGAAGSLLQGGQAAAHLEQSPQGLDLADDLLGLEVVEPGETQQDVDPRSVAANQVLDLVGQPRLDLGQDVVDVVAVDLDEGASESGGRAGSG